MIRLWLPVAAFMAAIYYGALMPAVPGPAATIPDAALHGGGYAVLALLTLRASAGGRWRGVAPATIAVAFLVATAHGVSVEFLQQFVPTRQAEWRDLGNNTIGAAAGLAAAWAWGTMKGTSR